MYLLLSPYTNEQNDFLHRLLEDKNLQQLPEYLELLNLFKTDEIINWRNLIKHFEKDLKSSPPILTTFSLLTVESGNKRLEDFKARIVEHVSMNRVITFLPGCKSSFLNTL
jgi:hypothetical protein